MSASESTGEKNCGVLKSAVGFDPVPAAITAARADLRIRSRSIDMAFSKPRRSDPRA